MSPLAAQLHSPLRSSAMCVSSRRCAMAAQRSNAGHRAHGGDRRGWRVAVQAPVCRCGVPSDAAGRWRQQGCQDRLQPEEGAPTCKDAEHCGDYRCAPLRGGRDRGPCRDRRCPCLVQLSADRPGLGLIYTHTHMHARTHAHTHTHTHTLDNSHITRSQHCGVPRRGQIARGRAYLVLRLSNRDQVAGADRAFKSLCEVKCLSPRLLPP